MYSNISTIKFNYYFRILLIGFLIFILSLYNNVYAQDTSSNKKTRGSSLLKLKVGSSKQYTERALPSERLAKKKLTFMGKNYQNLVSEFNFYFYARQEFNNFTTALKNNFKDNFNELLPLYDYNPEFATTYNIDSILDDCSKGILMHDLRSDIADDFYFMMAKTYYYSKNYSKALEILQFLNYNYADKNEVGFDIPIGSNVSLNKGRFTISNKEKKRFLKFLKRKPARPISILWQAKVFFELQRYSEAIGILELVKLDVFFPKKLKPFMYELFGYNYLQLEMYDSAANNLIKSLPYLEDNDDRARRAYLIAQLFEKKFQYKAATTWYKNAFKFSNNKIIKIYAKLNLLKLHAGEESINIPQNIHELLMMAKKIKYIDNQHVIFYVVAELYLKIKDTNLASHYLIESIKKSPKNSYQRQKSFILLGDLLYIKNKFPFAQFIYDTVDITNLSTELTNKINLRKKYLPILNENYTYIELQDTMQKYMGDSNKISKMNQWFLRKENQNKSFSDSLTEKTIANIYSDEVVQSALARLNNNGGTNTFYFQNNAAKEAGYSQFRKKWGELDNVDNWGIKSIIQSKPTNFNQASVETETDTSNKKPTTNNKKDIKNLIKSFPNTPAKLDSSNDLIIDYYIENAKIWSNDLEEYEKAITIYYYLINRFNAHKKLEFVYDELIKCLRILDKKEEINNIELLLQSNFPNGIILANRKKAAAFKKMEENNINTLAFIQDKLNNGFDEDVFAQLVNLQPVLDTGKTALQYNVLLAKVAMKLNNDSMAITTLDKIYAKTKNKNAKKTIDRIIEKFERKYELIEFLQNKQIKRVASDSFPEVVFDTVKMHIQELIDSLNARERRPKPPEPEPLQDSNKSVDTFYMICFLDKFLDKTYANETIKSLRNFNNTEFGKLHLKTEQLQVNGNTVLVSGKIYDTNMVLKYHNTIKSKASKYFFYISNTKLYRFYIVEKEKLNFIENEEMLKKNSNFILEKWALSSTKK